MTRILLVETASAPRVRKKAENILAGGIYEEPQVTILCREDPKTTGYFSEIPGARIVPLRKASRSGILRDLSGGNYDVLHMFWTGEKEYRLMKLNALRVKVKSTQIDAGDGGVFPLTWKACIRHWQFRRSHPLPKDYWDFLPQPVTPVEPEKPDSPSTGTGRFRQKTDDSKVRKVLLAQSADAQQLLRALELLKDGRLLPNARYTLFCRNHPEIVRLFQNHPMIHEIRTHSETRGSWKHIQSLRRQRFDTVVVFFTGDPSYWKMKYFAFLLGARHKLIFNEHNDCFFFNLRDWLALLSCRMAQESGAGAQPRWMLRARLLLFLLVKVLLFPFRFIWLLLVWLRLRSAAWIASS